MCLSSDHNCDCHFTFFKIDSIIRQSKNIYPSTALDHLNSSVIGP